MNIGIDLGGSHIAVGLVDTNGKIIYKIEEDINKQNNQIMECIIEIKIIELINKILKEKNMEIDEIKKIGIACPGEHGNGCMQNVVNLGIKKYPIVDILKNKLNFENISIRNDAKCAALAEKEYGSLKNSEDCVFLCIGTGIGGAAFINGELLVPKKNSGFEFGHMIIEKNGKQCKCGNRGCFETYGSMKNLKINISRNLNLNEYDSKKILKELRSSMNDEKIEGIIEEYLENLIIGLSNITNILEPELIAIGGSFVYYKDILWERLRDKFKSTNLLFNKEQRPELKLAQFGNDAGIIGASIDRI